MGSSDSGSGGAGAIRVIRSCTEMYRLVSEARGHGRRIGVVPTMGALHEGHLSLARASREHCDITVATIFVNPTQFGPREDFQKYPRMLEEDLQALAEVGADLVFVPTSNDMYPSGCSTFVEPPSLGRRWEGECRPGHFRGVATVVLKLFQIIPAHLAFFGQKDFQQCRVIQAMVRDLNVPIDVRVCPTIREADGLAMSSRNRYLSEEDRRRALGLSRCLKAAQRAADDGQRGVDVIESLMRSELIEAGVDRIEYAAIANLDTLDPVSRLEGDAVALIAAFVGTTRLIDNAVIRVP